MIYLILVLCFSVGMMLLIKEFEVDTKAPKEVKAFLLNLGYIVSGVFFTLDGAYLMIFGDRITIHPLMQAGLFTGVFFALWMIALHAVMIYMYKNDDVAS